jgi:DNA polymerase-3 subunit gamma/tau
LVTQALYRRWRSQSFAEIIGQDHVTHTLLNALRADRVAHAYLFSGPRGTGKTTTARVLAKAVNCLDPQNGEPCNRCVICRSLNEGRSLDLIEIDAASNRGIDEIRELRERIAFAPSECRYKVYVVDEVHMLTNEAFNALLKTLEEPPAHAIFVLATTEPQKIPATVLSRCQRFDFRRVSLLNLKTKLELICTQENVRIRPDALDAIARYASGSFRDAESLLDQLVSYGSEELSVEDVRRVLGAAPEEIVSGIVGAAVDADASTGLRLINEGLDSGVEPRQLTRQVLDHLRELLLAKSGSASLLHMTPEALEDATALSQRLTMARLLAMVRLFNRAANDLKSGVHAQLPLELALVEASLMPPSSAAAAGGPSRNEDMSGPSAPSAQPRSPGLRRTPQTSEPPGVRSAAQHTSVALQPQPPAADLASSAERDPANSPLNSGEGIDLTWVQENWGSLLQAIRLRNRMVEALLKSCEPVSVQDDLVTLGFYHGFHRDKVNEQEHVTIVEEALSGISGQTMRVKNVLLEGDRERMANEREASRRERLLDNPVVHEAINRYGAKVVDVQ